MRRRSMAKKEIKWEDVSPGDKVTILVHGGLKLVGGRAVPEQVERTGRCVMIGPAGPVLNMGGEHGTPGVATRESFVRATRGTRRA